MWKRAEEEQNLMATNHSGQAAVIGASLTLKGEISGEEDLLIEGALEGTVVLKGSCVTIGQNGSVTGDIHARVISVKGEVNGDLFGGEQVIIQRTGKVRGNVTAPQVCLENGAKLKGTIDMDPLPDAGAELASRNGQVRKSSKELNQVSLGGMTEDTFVAGAIDAEQ